MKTYKTESGMTFKESELVTNKNPYENGDGSWDLTKIEEWTAWNEVKEQYIIDELPAEKRGVYIQNKRMLQERMRIESEGK
jgi:hypothetical protein